MAIKVHTSIKVDEQVEEFYNWMLLVKKEKKNTFLFIPLSTYSTNF